MMIAHALRRSRLSVGVAAGVILLGVSPVSAQTQESFDDLLGRAKQLQSEGKFQQALTELSWAREKLEKQHLERLKSFFKPTIGELTGKDFKANAAMGLTSVEREYTSASGERLKVTLAGSSGEKGTPGAGFGALAGMAQMAAMMDNSGNTETLRLHGQRAVLSDMNGKLKLTLPLDSGSVITIESVRNKADKDAVIALASGLDVEGLNQYLAAK